MYFWLELSMLLPYHIDLCLLKLVTYFFLFSLAFYKDDNRLRLLLASVTWVVNKIIVSP